MTKTKRTPRSVKSALQPEWLKNTPEIRYTLYAFGSDHGVLEMSHEVQMTREEFVALKRHLAEMRGYKLTTEEEPHAS